MAHKHQEKMPLTGVAYAILAAVLFGITTPFAKGLLLTIKPILLAGIFYLGSSLGLALYLGWQKLQKKNQEAPLQRSDWGWLTGAIISGGILAPMLLMLGLNQTAAATASLFLNFEGVFTALIAWFVFKENFDRRIMLGMISIVLGGVLLSLDFSDARANFSTGALFLVLACLGWGIDNNLTRKVANANPAQTACLKGFFAGVVNISLGLSLGASVPALPQLATALVIGFLGYGVSLVLFVLALRHIGTARTGAYFAMAPFVGAGISIIFLSDPLTLPFMAAVTLMALGLWLHLTESHGHLHDHEEMFHDHLHSHDEHHQHSHEPGLEIAADARHSHGHQHREMTHDHPHFPDGHHNHSHGD
jgi:drug/metabolite transporter (DMT)-like permease